MAENQQAFEELKRLFTLEPLLCHPDEKDKIIVRVDASDGFVLAMMIPGAPPPLQCSGILDPVLTTMGTWIPPSSWSLSCGMLVIRLVVCP